MVNTYDDKSCFFHMVTNLGVGGVSSTCPTTKVILPHSWGKMANTGCFIVAIISRYPFVCRLVIITSNDSAYIYMHVDLCSFQEL